MLRFSDPAGSVDGSRKRRRRSCLPLPMTASAPRLVFTRLNSPARAYPYRRFAAALADSRRTARGHRGSLVLRCRAFSSPSPSRFIPALSIGKSAPVRDREADDPGLRNRVEAHAQPRPPAPRSPPRPHYPSRASASTKSRRPDLGRAPVARRSRYRPRAVTPLEPSTWSQLVRSSDRVATDAALAGCSFRTIWAAPQPRSTGPLV